MRLPTDPPPFVETNERQRTATLLDLRTCRAQHFSADLRRQSQQQLEANYVKFYVQYYAFERQKERCYYRITQAILDAAASEEPERSRLLRTAVRWYTGMPQILLRRGEVGPRLQLFLAEKFDTLINDWTQDAEKMAAKQRRSQTDTPQRRLEQCLNFIEKGHLRRGLRILVGLGRAPSDDAEIQEQMAAKHPAGGGPFELRETEDPPPDVSLMETLLELEPS